MSEFIREAVISTLNDDASVHLTPLGFRERDEFVVLAPFHPSRTLDNLRARGEAVLNFTDDVRVLAGCLTGRREWPTVATARIAVPRLGDCLAHWELSVTAIRDDSQRPQFECRIVGSGLHRPFTGFNRAQAAVVEAAVMVSRLDWLPPVEVVDELLRLRIAIDKTAGERELLAWQWLCDAVSAHARHRHEARRLPS